MKFTCLAMPYGKQVVQFCSAYPLVRHLWTRRRTSPNMLKCSAFPETSGTIGNSGLTRIGPKDYWDNFNLLQSGHRWLGQGTGRTQTCFPSDTWVRGRDMGRLDRLPSPMMSSGPC